MPDITNPQAIAFTNTQIRVEAEKLRAMAVRLTSMETDWFSGNNTVIGNSSGDVLQDGRDDEGVFRLTGADITSFVAIAIAVRNAINGASDANVPVVAKPCVRALEAA